MVVMVCSWVLDLSLFCVFKQKTAYEMRISDWSSDVCSSDLLSRRIAVHFGNRFGQGIAHEDQAPFGPARLLCDVDPAERPIMVGADDELAAGCHIGDRKSVV